MDINAYSSELTELGLADKGDRHKLVGLFAYNEFFNADAQYVTDVNDGIVVSPNYPISGIYLNSELEEDTLEIDIAYFPDSASGFRVEDILELISQTLLIIDNIKNYNRYDSGNDKAESILRDYLHPDEDEKPLPIVVRVITNFDLTEKEEYEVSRRIENLDASIKGLKVSTTICFGHQIIDSIASNKEPFECVKEGTLLVDSQGNKMSYGKDSIVVNVSAKSLKELWKKEGKRGLLAMNLRYYIKSKNIDEKITSSIMDDPKDFWYLNNGIIIVCEGYSFKGNTLKLTNFSIVNGGQTTNMIGTTPFDTDFYLLAKIIVIGKENEDKTSFVSRVAEASNTQKPIKAKDIIANKVSQRNLKTSLSKEGIFIEIKRGEKPQKDIYKEPWQRTKNNELAQDLYAFVYLQPGPARNNVSRILQDETKYEKIFEKHEYESAFIKDLLYLEKAYRKYASNVTSKKNEYIDATKRGLVKNGMFYCLAMIGYLLKVLYNPLYSETLQKYSGMKKKELYRNEQAFNLGFIDEKKSYNDFQKEAFTLFNIIFDNFIINAFKEAKEEKPELAYSNWTKTNVGFERILNSMNLGISMAGGENYAVKAIRPFFRPISDKEILASEKLYEKNIKSLDGARVENISEEDESLRNELMTLRFNFASSKRLPEKKIFTDKALENIVFHKPQIHSELRKYVSGDTDYFIGKEILSIVLKYIH